MGGYRRGTLFGRDFPFLRDGANGAASKGKGGKCARGSMTVCVGLVFVIGMYVQVIPFLCLEFIGISGEGGGQSTLCMELMIIVKILGWFHD
jgi:hypothetical protein